MSLGVEECTDNHINIAILDIHAYFLLVLQYFILLFLCISLTALFWSRFVVRVQTLLHTRRSVDRDVLGHSEETGGTPSKPIQAQDHMKNVRKATQSLGVHVPAIVWVFFSLIKSVVGAIL